jgi:hypothetical protein
MHGYSADRYFVAPIVASTLRQLSVGMMIACYTKNTKNAN